MGRVGGKACIVTGAGSGIGAATAVRLAEEGGRIVCADLNGDSAKQTAASIVESGGEAIAFTVDVSDSAQCDALIAECVKNYGSVDVLVRKECRRPLIR